MPHAVHVPMPVRTCRVRMPMHAVCAMCDMHAVHDACAVRDMHAVCAVCAVHAVKAVHAECAAHAACAVHACRMVAYNIDGFDLTWWQLHTSIHVSHSP